MKILALDCATKTGWALYSGRLLESGVQDFTKRRGDSNGMMFLRFRKWLDLLIATEMPDAVVYEQSHHRGGAATEIGVNLTGRVQEVCADRGVEFSSVHTTTLKKWATGHGKADKGQMMARAAVYIGRPPIDDNEADAVMLAAFAAEDL
mgnify:CR=1 FL=1